MTLTPPQRLILADLEFGSATGQDLADLLHYGVAHTMRLVRRLRALGLVRIGGWERVIGKNYQMLFALRHGLPDVPRPARRSDREIFADYYRRHRSARNAAHRRYYLAHREQILRRIYARRRAA